jgi:hypothetical protein
MNLSRFFLKARTCRDLGDLHNRITTAVALVNHDMLTWEWDEMDHHVDVCRI